jgi:hypothetical protein
MLLKFKHIPLLLISVLTFSCGENKSDDIDTHDDINENQLGLDSQKISAQNVFNAVPSRNVIIDLLQKSNAEYNPNDLNNPDEVGKYNIESAKALNLGVYGSDLNATNVFEQTQESMLFLKCVNVLAKSLGVSNAFDEQMVNRMEANKQNRDSTLEIISGAFKKADSFLRQNGRPGSSSLIVAGAWIEGLHLAISSAKETKNEAVIQEIFKQEESLKYLIELMQSSNVSQDAQYVLTDLLTLKAEFESSQAGKKDLVALSLIDKAISNLRAKIISPK